MNMNKLILSSLFIVTVLCSAQSCAQKLEEEHLVLDKTTFNQRLNKEETAQLIDVRTKKEFDQGAIEGAINYNLLDGTFENNLDKLDKKRTVYVYCAAGGRSGKAAKLLKEKGFLSVIDLKGGFNAWPK